MKDYVATFHTHLSALLTYRALQEKGIEARMMPVFRKLSSSCGTCVVYRSTDICLSCMDEDVERVYQIIGEESYSLLYENE